MEVYFDNSATTRVNPKAADVMREVMLESYGNPSSLHRMGVNAERIVKCAREIISSEMNVPTQDLYFTSCGSESNNLAIIGTANSMRVKGELITTKIEHKSVLKCFEYLEKKGFTTHYLDVDEYGKVDVTQLEGLLNENTRLVSIMHVNNEVGSIQPISEINKLTKQKNPNTLFHVDAVQSFCKLELPKGCADLISVSAHKVGGSKGVGALYIKKGIKVTPLIYGGGQEQGLRSGTENTPGIAGFGKAVELVNKKENFDYVLSLKKAMANKITQTIDNVFINNGEDSCPYILNISVIGLRSEILLHSLEQKGIYISSGSACSSRKPQPSHVLTAMGYSRDRVDSSMRISFSEENTMEEVNYACDALLEIVKANAKIRRKV